MDSMQRLKNMTGFDEDEIQRRREEFYKQFPDGLISIEDFSRYAKKILQPSEVEAFAHSVYQMFDTDHDKHLKFEEFVMATCPREMSGPEQKLLWLFDNVYDKVRVADAKLSRKPCNSQLHNFLANSFSNCMRFLVFS